MSSIEVLAYLFLYAGTAGGDYAIPENLCCSSEVHSVAAESGEADSEAVVSATPLRIRYHQKLFA